ncbi:class I glutamine amidotransferase-like protein [Gigaspora margarita]|uniref:D-lactate dehydratase n=1 Tax=Gigaspora margarita TaxID=4874 RepID=A0A8H3XJB3_GIGMA|nr:class I glutamine amidotransferase-like protein [Gigaspora margarita]
MTNQESKKALVLVADGTEEMEAVTTTDVLRRAQLDVTIAGFSLKNANYAKCSRGVMIVPDIAFSSISDFDVYDVIVIPGGLNGAETLSSSKKIQDLLVSAYNKGKIVAAICAGPLAIKMAGINLGGEITSHPVIKERLEGYSYREDSVVVHNKVITSRGPGTSLLFGLTIVEQLLGEAKRNEVSSPMMLASPL